MPRHLTHAELTAGLDHIRAAPKDNGALECIVSRPGHGERRDLASAASASPVASKAITGRRAAGRPRRTASPIPTSRSAS